MFFPPPLILCLYGNSLIRRCPEDKELTKMQEFFPFTICGEIGRICAILSAEKAQRKGCLI
ncbi:hypothetical protein HMPREF0262_01508 [Clostridium sp. ATCC 29733]|nr:hypothetical protein HMPREF0262_01508 [Clostridium sp. ATCC 29733]